MPIVREWRELLVRGIGAHTPLLVSQDRLRHIDDPQNFVALINDDFEDNLILELDVTNPLTIGLPPIGAPNYGAAITVLNPNRAVVTVQGTRGTSVNDGAQATTSETYFQLINTTFQSDFAYANIGLVSLG